MAIERAGLVNIKERTYTQISGVVGNTVVITHGVAEGIERPISAPGRLTKQAMQQAMGDQLEEGSLDKLQVAQIKQRMTAMFQRNTVKLENSSS